MGMILPLDESTYIRIAAGEAVERPASIIKELLENSIDAGADRITISISQGGTGLIKVADNGSGMDREDAVNAFMPHCTSKITRLEDLDTLKTLGFRGEALASIAAVSCVELLTRQRLPDDAGIGTKVVIKGGGIESVSSAACSQGTSITVSDLFYNTPARFKFLKRNATEAGYAFDTATRIALGNPGICMEMRSDAGTSLRVPGDGSTESAIFGIYGKEIANSIKRIDYFDKGIRITGYAGMPGSERSNRNSQSFFINGRYIRSKLVTAAVDEAYRNMTVKGRYPFIVLYIEMSPLLYDVNVHPQKIEVRFSSESNVFRSVFHSVNNTVMDNISPIHAGSGIFAMPAGYSDPAADSLHTGNIPSAIPDYGGMISNDEYTGGLNVMESGAVYGEQPRRILLGNAKIIGRLFGTYLLLESGDCFYMIDQHAAHERVIFERLKKISSLRAKGSEISQPLAVPAVLNLSPSEMESVAGEMDFIVSVGFETEPFGGNSILIRAVPYDREADDPAGMLKAVIDGLNDKGTDARYERAVYSLACKMAIKANDRINDIGMRSLLEELDKLDNPYTCPHGRPAVILLPKVEIEKLFKRRQA